MLTACLRHLHCTGLLTISDYRDTSILPLCQDCCVFYCQLKNVTKKCNDSIRFLLNNASILRLTNHDHKRLKNMTDLTAKWQQADLEPRILHKSKYLDNNGNRFIDSLNLHIRLYSYLQD